MTWDEIRDALAEGGFRGMGTRVRSRRLGDGIVSTAGNSGWGVTYDRNVTGWGTYQEYTPAEFFRQVRAGEIEITGYVEIMTPKGKSHVPS